jgi:uncharacterized membrane protein
MAEIAHKREAQHRADRIRVFREELAALEREGALALSREQRQKLDAHLEETLASLAARFDIDTTESQRQVSWGMRLASSIGALALCAAVYFFFYRYWGLLATGVQVALLVAMPLVCLLAAEFTAPRERTLYFTSLICLAAFAAFIVNLSVLAAMFNVTPTPGAFLAWALFALLVAYRYRLRLLLVAGLVCAIIYGAALLALLGGVHWLAFVVSEENLLIPGLLLIGASRIAPRKSPEEFPPVYLLLGLLTVFASVFVLSITAKTSYLPLDHKRAEAFYQVAGLTGAAFTTWMGIRQRRANVVYTGAGFFILFLYARFVDWWWDWMPKYLFFLVIGLISVALLVVFKRLRARLLGAPA